jgi:uncharacterized protein YciI
MPTLPRLAATLICAIALIGPPAYAQVQAPETPKLQQYVYVLRVALLLHDQAKWTQADNDAVGRHFARLAAATKAGQVIFAGKTSEPLDTTFGLVVFEAASEEEARTFMATDPASLPGS